MIKRNTAYESRASFPCDMGRRPTKVVSSATEPSYPLANQIANIDKEPETILYLNSFRLLTTTERTRIHVLHINVKSSADYLDALEPLTIKHHNHIPWDLSMTGSYDNPVSPPVG